MVVEPSPIGQTVGNYTILRKVSTGGMGTVYYAEHQLIGRSAAIKVLHPELSTSKDIVNRFFNEAKATTSIKHPGIVEVFDYGYMPSGDGYIIMEFLEGMSLARRLEKGGTYGEGEAALLVRGICSALAAAHAKGIVHRDLKPDNIFLIEDAESPIGERPKVLDFGIAKLTDVGLAGSTTKTGAVMGTPTYMSPEQCRGTGNVDHRADLYSLGCILYELVTGRPPFKNLGAGELIGAHQHLDPDPPSRWQPGISRDMEALIVRLLDKQPDRRVQSATELGRLLAKIAAKHGYHISVTHMTPVSITAQVPALDSPVSSRTEFAPDIEVTAPDPAPVPTTLQHTAAQSMAPTQARHRSSLWKLTPILALLAAGAIAFVTVRSDEPAKPVVHAAPAPSPPPSPPPPSPPPTPEPTPVASPEPSPSPSAPPVEEVKASLVKPAAKRPRAKVTPKVTTKPSPSPSPSPSPAKKIGPIETDI